MRPFERVRVVDCTHVLAGPFSTYQLAVLGAEVLQIERLDDPDQSRVQGSDHELNRRGMGTQYLGQGSNKRTISLDLKTEQGRDILKKLVATADVFVENFRPGAFETLGLGYEAMSALNPRLIYCSISAFGQTGPRGGQTAYDNVIQASSGLMAMTGTPEVNPIKFGAAAVDYATGTTCAFAIASALYQREKTGEGQRIDVAMFDVAMVLASSFIVNYTCNQAAPRPQGNDHPYFATSGCYQTKDGRLMVGGTNIRQQRELWALLGRPDMAKANNKERHDDREREAATLGEILKGRTADEWEALLQSHHIPASRVRSLAEALDDPQINERALMHHHATTPGVDKPYGVTVAAFKYKHGGPRIDTPPPRTGEHTEEVLRELGYRPDEVAALIAAKVAGALQA